jgi:hypothetical protein
MAMPSSVDGLSFLFSVRLLADLCILLLEDGKAVPGRNVDDMCRRVERHGILERQPHVSRALRCLCVIAGSKALGYGAEVHGVFDDVKVLRNLEQHRVDRLQEAPCLLVCLQ